MNNGNQPPPGNGNYYGPPYWPGQPEQPGFIANSTNTMRGWSGKFAAMTGYTYQPPQAPLERYHAPTEPLYQPWRRSRTTRIVHQMRGRRERWRRAQPRAGRVWGIILTLFALIIITITASSSAYGYSYYQSQLPQVQRLANLQISQTTRIYDRNGVALYDAYDQSIQNGGRRIVISYNDIPQVLQDAMIATEDHTFWDNAGIDPQGIVRAFIDHEGGGSGITQQVVKNLSRNDDPTLQRKLSEAAIAIGMTQQYPKWKILEMYFNVSPFGSQDLGVESAVEEYFHLMPDCKDFAHCQPGIKKLDYHSDQDPHNPLYALARASLLAGMPNQPSSNDPTRGGDHLKAALARQKLVLNLMTSFQMSYGPGPVTPEIAQKAEALTASWTFTPYTRPNKAPHFVQWVIDQVETALGNGDIDAGTQPFLTGGFNIRTTIDSRLEDYVERAVQRHLNQPEVQKLTGYYVTLSQNNNLHDGAVVVMNAKTGEILAMDGSSDYNSTDPTINGNVNVVTRPRPPGSTFKPIVYATAFEMGWYPGIVLPDVKTYFPNGQPAGVPVDPIPDDPNDKLYHPTDYGATYNNVNSNIRVGTANSYNIPAVKATQFVGLDNLMTTAQRMGITSLERTGVSMGIGSTDVSLLQMTGAYQVFADNGVRVPPQGILDIWDNYGHNLYHYDTNTPPGVRVLSEQISFLTTSILIDEPARAAEFGHDHDLSFADIDANCAYVASCQHQVATKTGTTDDFRDNWTIGYTPDVVVGVWTGNADNTAMRNVIGITGAAPIWHSVMERVVGRCNDVAHYDNPFTYADGVACGDYQAPFSSAVQFTQPAGLHLAQVNTYNGLQGYGYTDLLLDGQDPQQSGLPPAQDPGHGHWPWLP